MALESISYRKVSAAGVTQATYTAVLALRRMISRRAEGVGGTAQAIPERARWHIDAESLQTAASDTTFRPRRGDQLVSADSGTWVIEGTDSATFKTRFACDCLRLEA